MHDLIGSNVFLGDRRIGLLNDILVSKAHDLYVIASDQGEEILIPAVSEYIKGFDAEMKRLDLTDESVRLLND